MARYRRYQTDPVAQEPAEATSPSPVESPATIEPPKPVKPKVNPVDALRADYDRLAKLVPTLKRDTPEWKKAMEEKKAAFGRWHTAAKSLDTVDEKTFVAALRKELSAAPAKEVVVATADRWGWAVSMMDEFPKTTFRLDLDMDRLGKPFVIHR
jgi:hypothetical protein